MEKRFASDYIVVIVGDRYIRDYNQEVDNASGARFEGAMLSSFLLQNGAKFDQVAVVCFDRWRRVQLPPLLHGCQRYYVDQQGEYEKLRDFVSGKAIDLRPVLGAKPGLGSPALCGGAFLAMCRSIWPLMEENRRLFEAFGPNSGTERSSSQIKNVRFDLTIWYGKRADIVENNGQIAHFIRLNRTSIPDLMCRRSMFTRLNEGDRATPSEFGCRMPIDLPKSISAIAPGLSLRATTS